MKDTRRIYSRRRPDLTAAIPVTAAFVLGSMIVVWAQPAVGRPDPSTFPYRDLTVELSNKMTGRFTVAAVGDVLIMEPVGPMMDQKLVKILREADTTVGNLESTIVDRRNWSAGYRGNTAPRESAADLASIGFDLMNNGTRRRGRRSFTPRQRGVSA
jgi:hypothetical protein